MLEQTGNRRYAESHNKEYNQPRNSLFHGFHQRFVQIFLCSQTCKHRIVLSHFLVYYLDQVMGRHNTNHTVVIIQNRNRIL